ncbi:EamA family transporter [bacterium]|nr:EamA family transporter [bacterium]
MTYRTGVQLVLTAGVLWSVQALIICQILEAGSWAILFWRSAAMLPVLVVFLTWRTGGAPLPALRTSGLAGVLGGLGLVVAMGGAILAFQSTTVANAAFLFAASPFLAAVLGRAILGERVAPRTWAAIGLALVGIFVMVQDGLSGGALVGNAAALISALGFAAFTVALRWRHLDDSLPSVVLGALFSIIAAALVCRQTGQVLAVPLTDVLWCVAMGAVTLSGGMILYTFGSRVVPSAELALLSNTEVMLAPVWVWLVLGETASAATFVGGAILLAAIVFNALSGVRRPSQA